MSSLISWLRRIHADHPAFQAQADRHEPHDLSLRDALQLHKDWRLQLEQDLMAGRITDSQRAHATGNGASILSRWLHGAGRERFGHRAAWSAACNAHNEAQQCADDLLLAHQMQADADSLTRHTYRLRDACSRCQLELVRLFTSHAA